MCCMGAYSFYRERRGQGGNAGNLQKLARSTEWCICSSINLQRSVAIDHMNENGTKYGVEYVVRRAALHGRKGVDVVIGWVAVLLCCLLRRGMMMSASNSIRHPYEQGDEEYFPHLIYLD